MKKIFSMLILVVFGIALVACDDDENGGTKKIALSYADWGDQVFNRQMLDAFEVKYPHIKVTLREDIPGSGIEFTTGIQTAAQNGMVPDVFAIDNVPTVIQMGVTYDVTELWNADADAELVYPNIANTAVYNNKRLAIPSFQFFKGIAINKGLVKRANLTTVEGKYRIDDEGLPVKDWTYDEMIAISEAIANRNLDDAQEFVLGIEPWYGTMDFQQVWPSLDNESMQYDTWDGKNFNYTSELWISAMKEKVRVHQLKNGTIDDITDEDIFEKDGNGELTTNVIPGREFLQGWKLTTGYTAMGIHGTWNLTSLITETEVNSDIDMGFWPYPGGDAGQFPPVILDYQIVSSETKYPKEAYLLAKWMTYGRDGWNARMDIFTENYDEVVADGKIPARLTSFPIAAYDEVWAKIDPYIADVEGLPEIVANIEKSKPDLDKWIPGYRDFWNWANDENNQYGWPALLEQGVGSVETFAAQWNSKINDLVKTGIANLGK